MLINIRTGNVPILIKFTMMLPKGLRKMPLDF